MYCTCNPSRYINKLPMILKIDAKAKPSEGKKEQKWKFSTKEHFNEDEDMVVLSGIM